MLGDNNSTESSTSPEVLGTDAAGESASPVKKTAAKKAAAKKTTTKATSVKASAAKAPAKTPTKTAAKTTKSATSAKKTSGKKSAAKPATDADLFAAPAAEAATAPATGNDPGQDSGQTATTAPKVTTRTRRTTRAVTPASSTPTSSTPAETGGSSTPESATASGTPFAAPVFQAPAVTTTTRSARKRPAKKSSPAEVGSETAPSDNAGEATSGASTESGSTESGSKKSGGTNKSGGTQKAGGEVEKPLEAGDGTTDAASSAAPDTSNEVGDEGRDSRGDDRGDGEGSGGQRRRRRRGGRRRRKPSDGDGEQSSDGTSEESDSSSGQSDSGSSGSGPSDKGDNDDEGQESNGSRRRRRRRRQGEEGDGGEDDPANTVTRVRKGRSAEDEITAVTGSTRLEAKKQRRREGREAGRRRAPIVSEAEFLARRESVDRVMAVRQRDDLTQIAVLEDKVLVEHYVARESQTSLIGNVYVGRVQNVLPSMEAAFIDIGKGRNAVLYAGEVNWSALGHKDGQPRKIESVLSSGQSVLVQVTKDPVGHKGARLTSQVSLAGRFLVYVPDGTTSGISRKLPDTERNRLKKLLKEIVPDSAGVIVRTAAEGASEDELTRDVERLKARWEDIDKGAKKSSSAPKLLYGEPDLTLKVVRDLFTEDFSKLVIQGDDAWDTVQGYVSHVAPDLEERLERFDPEADDSRKDLFAAYRIDEQIAKGLDRKVWLPSGGSLIIDRTEAMTVVDVNTGKFTGSGGNLEETVTKNNLEAAEEIVRQLRLRDIGGIIVVDFIDMVLESNRDLVLRRLVECLGRDRTRHQVAEVTSLGLVQMTRKRIGTGLLEAFSEDCDHCAGRGLVVHDLPIEPKGSDDDSRRGRRGRGKGKGDQADDDNSGTGGSGNGNSGNGNSGNGNSGSRGGKSGSKNGGKNGGGKKNAGKNGGQASSQEPSQDSSQDQDAMNETETEQPAVKSPTPAEFAAMARPEATTDSPPESTGEAAEPTPVAESVEAPAVVSRNRRRGAGRPADQPDQPVEAGQVPAMDQVDVTAGTGQPATDGLVEPGVVDREPGTSAPEPDGRVEETADDAAPELHVPIKKKGGRRR